MEYLLNVPVLLFTLENLLWINLGVLIGMVFAAIPGLSVILCIILFLPVTYELSVVSGMMFLLGIYCAGGFAGSVSAILINTPGTPHAACTMLDGYPLSRKGRTGTALKLALYASTIGGIFSALVLLFLSPAAAQIAASFGTAEYFMVCLFGLTIIAGVSGKSLVRGIISACLGLLLSCVGADPMTGYDRFTFGIERLYLGLDLAVCLIGLFALVEIMEKAQRVSQPHFLPEIKDLDGGRLTREEKKRLVRPIVMSSIIGVIVGIIPGTGASEGAAISYGGAKRISSKPEEFGQGSIEGVVAAESANNAVTGATLIPLLTLGIPGDATVAIMLSALTINGLNPGIGLFTTDGDIMYTIMIGLIAVNLFMLLQGLCLTKIIARVLLIPEVILCPVIVIFCFAGAYSVNKSYFDIAVALVFGLAAWILRRLDLPLLPVLLGLVLGHMIETNFRRALFLSDGNYGIFVSSAFCVVFLALIILSVFAIAKSQHLKLKKVPASGVD